MILLDIKESKINAALDRLDREKDIYDNYLDYLFKTNAILLSPDRNFLKT